MTKEKSDTLARMSMSLPLELFEQLDVMVAERGLPSRSQLLSELIRHALVAHEEEMDTETVMSGTITTVYVAESGRVRHQIANAQREYAAEIISSQHVNLENDQSLEVLVVQGRAARLRTLCDGLRKLKGVQQLNLVTTSALLPPLHNKSFEKADLQAA